MTNTGYADNQNVAVDGRDNIDIGSLRRTTARGGAYTIGSQAVTTVIQLTSTIVLARLLTPDDFGVVAMVTAVTVFAGLFRDLGLSSASVQKKDLSHGQQSNLFWLNVAMGFALTLGLSLASPIVSWFYGRSELTAVTIALSTNFLIASLGAQHNANLAKNMRFGRIAICSVSGAMGALIVAVTMALSGYSFWALVFSTVAQSTVSTILLSSLSSFWPGLPKRKVEMKSLLTFGASVTAFNVVNYFHRNLDNVLIGRVWGTGPLGMYSRAYSLLMLPINAIRGPINSAMFPALCKLQNHPVEYAKFYRQTTEAIAILSMPLVACLAVNASQVVELFLGAQWGPAVPIFTALSLVAFIQPVITTWGLVSLSRGEAGRYLTLGIINTVVSVIGFLAGLNWGALGVAMGYAVATYVSAIPILYVAFRETPIKMGDFFEAIWRSMVASLVTSGVLFVSLPETSQGSLSIRLSAYSVLFATLFVGVYSVLPGGYYRLSVAAQMVGAVLRKKKSLRKS